MTKVQIEKYGEICAEISDIKATLNAPVKDVVHSSSKEYPYTQHSVTIVGIPNMTIYTQKLKVLQGQKKEIEDFVDTLPYKQKKIVQLKIYTDLTWDQIAGQMSRNFNKSFSRDSVRAIYRKILKDF